MSTSLLRVTHLTMFGVCFGILVLAGFAFYFSRERKKRRWTEGVLQQQTDRERLVTQIALQIRQSLDLDQVLTTTVSEVQRFLQADRVLIYRIWPDGTGCAIHETVLPHYSRVLGQSFPEEVFPKQYHASYSLGKVLTINDVEQAEIPPCLVDFVQHFGVKAKLVVPILQENREALDVGQSAVPVLWGLLIAHQCVGPRQWDAWEVELMKQLATQVAIAVQQSELYERLQQLNADLEGRVQRRTEELAKTNASLQSEVSERKRTEAALHHTNYKLQALISASPRAIFTLNLEDKVQIWNPAAEQILGWQEAEVINQSNPVFKGDREYNTLRESVLQGATYPRVELRRQKKDGTPIDIVFSAAPLQDGEEQINGIVVVIADITEQKQQAEQVRLLQSVVVNTNDAVVITEAQPIDGNGPQILYVNEAFTHITGYTLAEVLGKTPRILQGPKTDRAELAKIRTALSRWKAVTVEVINYRKDGSEFWNEFSIVPVADQSGWYTHWIAVQRDTSGRKQVEQALRQSEQRFRSLIEQALDIITILDTHGTIHYESPSVEKVLGYSTTELVGKRLFEYVHPDDFANTYYNFTSTVKGAEGSLPIEVRFLHKDGSWRTLEAISQRFVDSSGQTAIMMNSRDITERKRLNEIRLALEREKELGVLKTRFFSMASHEFRTPLSTALAAAQLLEGCQDDWNDSGKRLRNLHRIQDSVKNVVQLLDDILTINRAETGKLEFNPRPIDLVEFCGQLIEEFRLSAGTGYILEFVSGGNPAVLPSLDERLLRSILANLLSNAIKYSPQGGTVWVELMFEKRQVRLEVQDQGIGISLEDQGQLFEPFHRGKNVHTIPGTGLGLVVVKKCVDLHRGAIAVISEVGQGTTCVVTLPVVEAL